MILVLGWLVCVPGRLHGETGNTEKVPVMLARGDTPADKPAVKSGAGRQGSVKAGQQTQGREQEGQNTVPKTSAKKPYIKEFVPSEEIAAEQAVDFPADI